MLIERVLLSNSNAGSACFVRDAVLLLLLRLRLRRLLLRLNGFDKRLRLNGVDKRLMQA